MKDGVYLDLFHGRAFPSEQLEDWGKQGPLLGPFAYVHTTYNCHVKIEWKDEQGNNQFGELVICGDGESKDSLYYDGFWYGDWSVYASLDTCTNIEISNMASRLVPFDQAKATPPENPATGKGYA